MRFAVLGPLDVLATGARAAPGVTAPGDGGAVAAPKAPKVRAVLATLLLRRNTVVSVASLIDELWHDAPPRTAVPTLQVYVSQLRKLLHRLDPATGRDRLVTRSPGYLLRLAPGELDVTEFEELHAQGGRAMAARAFDEAVEIQRRALTLWRGPLLCDTPHGSILAGAAIRLTELRVAALERRVRAELCLGRHRDLVGELWGLAADFPTREEIHAHLMVALYRTGRSADALRVFDRLAGTLGAELGIEPGPRLRQLRQRIRTGDATLLHPAGLPRTADDPEAAAALQPAGQTVGRPPGQTAGPAPRIPTPRRPQPSFQPL
ncbi:AfsR/SARP family transcriptional regulator [Streptomyces sp. 4N509B]|uniref:AfsR/SARP family transcriptional regulator n=1 Tax=Streptomyces sp. 4N509B TaxID=3457413 RepID=UPI003FD654A1